MKNMVSNINLELTTACPLKCAQCYCSLNSFKHMDFEVAKYWINEAAKSGIENIALSGGETMCYPHLFEVIEYAKEKGFTVAAAFSGWKFSEDIVDKLFELKIDNISISLNGSTEEVNYITRDGYQYAINALDILRKKESEITTLNWVMHSNNCKDFPKLLELAEKYNVNMIDIISFKPDSKKQMKSFPSKEQICWISDFIKGYKGKVKISVETCFPQLLAVLHDTALFGCLNFGINRGCRAGVSFISINVDGTISPCRHIHYKEKIGTISEYFEKSKVIKQINMCNETNAVEPCKSCKYLYNCKPCMAINTEINDCIKWSNELCPLQ